MNLTVAQSDAQSVLKILSTFDAKGALAAFEGEDVQTKIQNGLIMADDLAQILGIFFPPAAVVASDLGIAIEVEKLIGPLIAVFIAWAMKQASVRKAVADIETSPLNPVNAVPKALGEIGGSIGEIGGFIESHLPKL